MEKNNNKYAIYFCGISKNCFDNIDKNLNFLSKFNSISNLDSKIIIVDSDSIDGTKNIIKKYEGSKNFIIKDLDGLEDSFPNRIERISISRNACLEIISKINIQKKIIYIPIDLDLDLFKFVSLEQLNYLIKYCIDEDSEIGIFPFSLPYYYDIFALRAEKWVNYNAQLRNNKIKKYLLFGSFFLNYLFIFRHQYDLYKFKKSKYKIKSAFGGMGIYNLNSNVICKTYQTSKKNPEFVSEHVLFNSKFNNLEIIQDWNIPAPPEHLEFKLLNFRKKIIYFFRTFYFDLFNRKNNSY